MPQAPRRVGRGPRGDGVSPSLFGNGSGEGAGCAPSPENFSYFFVGKTYFDAFWHMYFLNHRPMGGVLTP